MMMTNKLIGWDARTAVTGARAWIKRPRSRLIAGLAFAMIGVGASWNWLAAVGALPVILSTLPCLAMCALGLCMRGMTGRSCNASARGQVVPSAESDASPSAEPEKEKVDA